MLREDGLPHDRRQLQPGDDHDRPRLRRPHVSRAARPRRRRRRAAARAARRAAADDGRPDRAEPRTRAPPGRCAGGARRRADRRRRRRDRARGGPRAVQAVRRGGRPARPAFADRDDARPARRARDSRRRASRVHARRSRRRLRRDRGAAVPPGRARARRVADHAGARRGVGARLGRVRARGRPRPRGQRRDRLLDREPRSDGRAHRRLDHRRAADDTERRGVPGAAQRRDRGRALGRRRHRRIEHPVRAGPRHGGAARDRDEPARVAVVGARVEGDRLPDRQGRREARRRLHARRESRTTSPARPRPASSRRSTTSS